MVPRKKKYESGEASNFMTRKRALKKLQLTLKVCHFLILVMVNVILAFSRICLFGDFFVVNSRYNRN